MAFCERQQKQFAIQKPLFERTFCALCTSASVERVFNNGGYLLDHPDASKAQCVDCRKLFSLGSNKQVKQTVHRLKCHLEKCHKDIYKLYMRKVESSDVVLETRVLVSRRLEDKNESLGLGSWSHGLGLEYLVLVSVSKKKSCSFSRLLLFDARKAQCIDCGNCFHSVAINQENKLFTGSNVI